MWYRPNHLAKMKMMYTWLKENVLIDLFVDILFAIEACPLGAYCPRGQLNQATGMCDP